MKESKLLEKVQTIRYTGFPWCNVTITICFAVGVSIGGTVTVKLFVLFGSDNLLWLSPSFRKSNDEENGLQDEKNE